MIVTKTDIGSEPAGSELSLSREAEARLVQRGLAKWAGVAPTAKTGAPADDSPHEGRPLCRRTKAELRALALEMGLEPDGDMTKAQLADAIRGAS